MTTVSHLLRTKGHAIWSVGPDDTVFDALRILADKGVGMLLVLENEHLVGIFSERDYARKIILQGKSSKDTLVRDVMTSQVICVHPEQTIEECMALMTANHIRHLPVLAGERVVGVVSIGDLVKSIISEQEFMIEQLENYIMSPPTPSVQPPEPPVRATTLEDFMTNHQRV